MLSIFYELHSLFSIRVENSADLDLKCLKKDKSRFSILLLAAMLYEDNRAYIENFDALQVAFS